jgi:hypothetical protein
MRSKIALGAFFATVLAAGCQHSLRPPAMALPEPRDACARVEILRNVQFADLPAPHRDFRFNRRASQNFQGSYLRGGNVVYDGYWAVAAICDWYLAEMPKTGWHLERDDAANAYDRTYFFRKNDEVATIRVWHVNDLTRVDIGIDKVPVAVRLNKH